MAKLKVPDGLRTMPLTCDVYNSKHELVRRQVVLPSDQHLEMPLPPGDYQLRLLHPFQDDRTYFYHVGSELHPMGPESTKPPRIRVAVPANSIREAAERFLVLSQEELQAREIFFQYHGFAYDSPQGRELRGEGQQEQRQQKQVQQRQEQQQQQPGPTLPYRDDFPNLWIRLWAWIDDRWMTQEMRIAAQGSETGSIHITIWPKKWQSIAYLQYGADDLPWRLFPLAESRIELQFEPGLRMDSGLRSEPPFWFFPVTDDSWFYTLLAHNAASAIAQLRTLHAGFAEVSDPKSDVTWILHAIWLWQVGEYDKCATVLDRLLPVKNGIAARDVQILAALIANKRGDKAAYRANLLAASVHGLPFWMTTARWLFDGLEALARHEDQEAKQRLERLEPFTAALDWNSPYATFVGRRPDQPVANSSKMGAASQADGVHYLFEQKKTALIPETARTAVHSRVDGSRSKGVKVGEVVSAKSSRTCVVKVHWTRKDRKYGKLVRGSTKCHVHDERDEAREGDWVEIRPCRKRSKLKTWELVRVLPRGIPLENDDHAAASARPLTSEHPGRTASVAHESQYAMS